MKTIIIVVVLLGLSAVAGSIIVGSRYFDGIVVDKPYETGLSWDRTRHENADAGWNLNIMNATFRMGNSDIVMSVFDKNGNILEGADISVSVSRPSSKDYDKTYRAVQTGKGQYKASVQFPLYGYWDMKMSILKEGRRVTVEKRVFADKGA